MTFNYDEFLKRHREEYPLEFIDHIKSVLNNKSEFDKRIKYRYFTPDSTHRNGERCVYVNTQQEVPQDLEYQRCIVIERPALLSGSNLEISNSPLVLLVLSEAESLNF